MDGICGIKDSRIIKFHFSFFLVCTSSRFDTVFFFLLIHLFYSVQKSPRRGNSKQSFHKSSNRFAFCMWYSLIFFFVIFFVIFVIFGLDLFCMRIILYYSCLLCSIACSMLLQKQLMRLIWMRLLQRKIKLLHMCRHFVLVVVNERMGLYTIIHIPLLRTN